MKLYQIGPRTTLRLVGITLAPVLLALNTGCATRSSPPPPAADPAGLGFTLETPVQKIAADPLGRAVLDRDMPGLTTNPNYPVFKVMTLNQLASLSDGKITQGQLVQLKADLANLSASEDASQ